MYTCLNTLVKYHILDPTLVFGIRVSKFLFSTYVVSFILQTFYSLNISTAKQTFEPSFPGEPIVQKNPVEKPFSIEFPRPDNPSRFTEQPYVSIQQRCR